MAKNIMKNTRQVMGTPQSQPARADQIPNNAGGYAFPISDKQVLDRMLIIGTQGGTFYVDERKLTAYNADRIIAMIEKDGKAVVDRTVEVSDQGLSYRNDAAIFVLALCAASKNLETRKYALANLSKVCRIGTHLFTFIAFRNQIKKSWSRSFRTGIANWYNSMSAEKLAVQVCKYQSRSLEGELSWTHKDLLRLSHAAPITDKHNLIFRYITHGVGTKDDFKEGQLREEVLHELEYVWAHERAKIADEKELINLIKQYHLTHESIPTDKQTPKVLEQLLQTMPMTATIRQLGRLTNRDVLKPLTKTLNLVCDRITNDEQISKSRIHPMSMLAALRTYSSGQGFRGKLTWTPIQPICDALDVGFYKAFKNVQPTGKRILLAVDISGSMDSPCMGMDNMTARDCAAAMALCIAKVEPNYHVIGFCDYVKELEISPKQRLDDVIRYLHNNVDPRGTDCSLPMSYAMDKKMDIDCFILITDNETWAGNTGHPFEILEKYRRQFNPNTKLISLATAANNVSVADQNDAGILDIAGFSSDVPSIVSKFIAGEI
jgi:60 kDa SS-A/Ro ribonucleoprotein